MDAGLSLADIAGDEVSRTLIHFIEHGRARPSRRVLEIIAERTGRPIDYFLLPEKKGREPEVDSLAAELSTAAIHVQSFVRTRRLSQAERVAMTLVEVNLHQAAALAKTLEKSSRKRSKR